MSTPGVAAAVCGVAPLAGERDVDGGLREVKIDRLQKGDRILTVS